MNTNTPAAIELIMRALGTKKAALLTQTPLRAIVREKLAAEKSVVSSNVNIVDVIGALTKTAYEKRVTARKLNEGVAVMRALMPNEKTASAMHTMSFFHKVAHVRKLDIAMQCASPAASREFAQEKVAYEDAVYLSLYKQAGVLDHIPTGDAARELGKKMLTGGAYATGATVPLVAGGSYLSDKSTSDARDKALQAAGGVAAMGAGMYGIHKLTSGEKRASHNAHMRDFTNTVFIDACLRNAGNDEKTASMREFNREYGVFLLNAMMQN